MKKRENTVFEMKMPLHCSFELHIVPPNKSEKTKAKYTYIFTLALDTISVLFSLGLALLSAVNRRNRLDNRQTLPTFHLPAVCPG